jgi:hypothetical protein
MELDYSDAEKFEEFFQNKTGLISTKFTIDGATHEQIMVLINNNKSTLENFEMDILLDHTTATYDQLTDMLNQNKYSFILYYYWIYARILTWP